MKRYFNIFIAVFALMTVFCACNPETDTLKVSGTKNMFFDASGNEGQERCVSTTAADWDIDRSDDWIVCGKDGDKLIVNVADCPDRYDREGSVTVIAGNAMPKTLRVLQYAPRKQKPVLSLVSGKTDVVFDASANEPELIGLRTNIDYEVKTEDWIVVSDKTSTGFRLDVTDNNASDSRVRRGRVILSAADENDKVAPIVIEVAQASATERPHSLKVFAYDNGTKVEVSNLLFVAAGNPDKELLIETDAGEWYAVPDEGQDWILLEKDGNTLKVNVKDTDMTVQSLGKFIVTAGNAAPEEIYIVQDAAAPSEDYIVLSPDSKLFFDAVDDKEVILDVESNREDWTFEIVQEGDWLEIDYTENRGGLSVRVRNNDNETERSAFIVVKAGIKMDKVSVEQAGKDVEDGREMACFEDADDSRIDIDVVFDELEDGAKTRNLKLTLKEPVSEEVVFEIVTDDAYLKQFNDSHDFKAEMRETEYYNVQRRVSVPAGGTEVTVALTINSEDLPKLKPYLIPLKATVVSGPAKVKRAMSRVNYIVRRKGKVIKNVACLEVNNTNPLNMLEYLLNDGTPFFDTVILFSGNVHGETDCKFYANPNIRELLDNSDKFIKPLRDKKIRVLMGLMNDHQKAGVSGLSELGARLLAKECVGLCRTYGIDGFFLDDEYGGYGGTTNWFNPPAEPTRLAYELKMAMNEAGLHDGISSYFCYGRLGGPNEIVDSHRGTVTDPADYVDFYVANYGGATTPVGDKMTNEQCSCLSIECNLGRGFYMTEEFAKRAVINGFGWCFWFAFHPQQGGGLGCNAVSVDPMIRDAARGFYDQELKTPEWYYEKNAEDGGFSTERKPRTGW